MKNLIDKETARFLFLVFAIVCIVVALMVCFSSCTVVKKTGTTCDDGLSATVDIVVIPLPPRRDTLCVHIDTVAMNDPCYGIHCDDLYVCTFDRCEHGVCDFEQIPGCDTIDVCDTVNCADMSACTDDFCFDTTSVYGYYCTHPLKQSLCDDGESCTADYCTPYVGGINFVCNHITASCDDSNPCTADECVQYVSMHVSCRHTLADCDDWDLCTSDTCNRFGGGCVYEQVSCEDFNHCTNDYCIGGHCMNTPVNCDDGDACTVDSCNAGIAIGEGCWYTDTCTTPCSFDTLPRYDGASWCKVKVCVNGDIYNAARNCDDGDYCTTDVCNSIAAVCVHPEVYCFDGNEGLSFCCDPSNGYCLYGDYNCCYDNNACTMEYWNSIDQVCQHLPVNCDDGSGSYWCDIVNGCQYGSMKNVMMAEIKDYTVLNVAGQVVYKGSDLSVLAAGIYFTFDGVRIQQMIKY